MLFLIFLLINLKFIWGIVCFCCFNDKELCLVKLKILILLEELSDEEVVCWIKIVIDFQNVGIVIIVDVKVFIVYCKVWCGWIVEICIVEEEGLVVIGGIGGLIINLYVWIVNDYFK